jgi:hypothetical protein
MRLQIEPTHQVMTLDGIPVRAWNGVSEEGVPCVVFVHRIVVWAPESEHQATLAFDDKLLNVPVPNMVRVVEDDDDA